MDAIFTDYTLRTVALGAAVLGAVSGALGTFAVLRGQSLLGDAMSHAALPGIALAYLLTGSKAPLVLMLGAGVAGWGATYLIARVVEGSRVKYDSALGLALSVFFGVGLVLLTFIQQRPDAAQAGLDTFLFGQAAALVTADVRTMALLGGAAVLGLGLFWKEFKVLAFDPAFGASLGLPMRRLDRVLTLLLVVAIVIGLQAVGVVLMSALVVAPAAAARQWTDRLGLMVALAAAFGAASGVGGALASSWGARLPTGPMIVLAVSLLVGLSLLFGARRGLVAQALRRWRSGRRLRMEAVLLDLYALAQQHSAPGYPHTQQVLDVMNEAGATSSSLEGLAHRGLVRRTADGRWALTEQGTRHAQAVLTRRAERAP